MKEEDEIQESLSDKTELKTKQKKENQYANLKEIVDKMQNVDNDILLAEMNKMILELKNISNEKQTLESKTMLDNINTQNDSFSKLLVNSADKSADSSMLSKI